MFGMNQEEEHPQVTSRGSRTFRDQFDRKWHAVIENKTGHPVHPPVPIFEVADHRLIPPEKYVQPRAEHGADGDLFIDLAQWHTDLIDAWAAYEERKVGMAEVHNKDNPAEAVRNPSPFLRKAWGVEPMHPKIVRAMMARNKWVLGFSMQKPGWVTEEILPPVMDTRRVAADLDVEDFYDAEDEGVFGAEESAAPEEFPQMYGPGRWRLSDGTTMQGKREDAEAAQAAIREFAEV